MQRVTPGADPSVHTCGPSFSPLLSGGQDRGDLSWEALLAEGPLQCQAPPTCTSPPARVPDTPCLGWTRELGVSSSCGGTVWQPLPCCGHGAHCSAQHGLPCPGPKRLPGPMTSSGLHLTVRASDLARPQGHGWGDAEEVESREGQPGPPTLQWAQALTLIIALDVMRKRVARSLTAFSFSLLSAGIRRPSSSFRERCSATPCLATSSLHVLRSSSFSGQGSGKEQGLQSRPSRG